MLSSMSWTLLRSLRPMAKDRGLSNCKAMALPRGPSSSSSSDRGDDRIVPYGGHVAPPDQPVYHNRPGEEPWHHRHGVPGSGLKKFKWPNYNERIHPPQPDVGEEGSELDPAYVVHMRAMIKYSPWKMWYLAELIRGMTVDEAIKQMSFINKKGALHIRETLEEAVELAQREHEVEFKTKLWVAESICHKAGKVSGMRRHARGAMSQVNYYYTNYFVRLEEGDPPAVYDEVHHVSRNPEEWLEYFVAKHRSKTIPSI